MLRSLYSAISGLKNHETKMDVIGNNIANVNTTGFKRSRTNFVTMLSQTLKGASMPAGNQARTNAVQVGFGAMLGSIDQVTTQGSAQSTGKDTDLMIQGSGYFVMDNNGQQVFTRAGGFGFDYQGYLADPTTGARVLGYTWGSDENIMPDWNSMGPIKFSLGDALAIDSKLPLARTAMEIDANDFTDKVYQDDELIGAANVNIQGLKRIPAGQIPGVSEYTFDSATGTVTLGLEPDSTLNFEYIAAFDVDSDLLGEDGKTLTVSYLPLPGAKVYDGDIVYTEAQDPTNIGENEYYARIVDGKYQITFGTEPNGPIGYDFNNAPHLLESFTIDQTGVITGVYNDGISSTTHKIAQLAIAKFSNEAGLTNLGNSYMSISSNSGQPQIGGGGEDGRGMVLPGQLEMSNVDLSQEFTDMIVTQRGFQANSRVITVSDTLLQELIDLKRQ